MVETHLKGEGIRQGITAKKIESREGNTKAFEVMVIPTRGNLFLPVCLIVWADGRGTVPRADSAARAELRGAPKQKLLQLKNRQKYHWVKHSEMPICCFDVSLDM
jgi:hypothetical protein